MRFRHKVIMMNIAFLSVALGVLGFVIIYRNFNQALDLQTSYAIEENNLIQSSVEYQLLNVINTNYSNIKNSLPDIGQTTNNSMISQFSYFYIVYDNQLLYRNDPAVDADNTALPDKLLSSLRLGEKKYLINRENQQHYIYVASKNIIDNTDLYIVTKREADDTFLLLYDQIQYFFILMLTVLIVCSFFLYFLSRHLTNPIEQLNVVTEHFARGNYHVRARITTNDEIGMLAKKFNDMALSVSEHIEELNLMVKQHEQFVADFTHEIKTPMTTIIGYADTLRTKNLSLERQNLAYQYIYSEGKRLEAMSMKLFDLIYLKEHDIVKSEISVSTLVGQITESMQPILNRKNIRFTAEAEPAVVFGDAELLKTVFINLIDNARKASEENSIVTLRGFAGTDGYLFQITDSGCGMDDETIRHICDEFYMADKSRARKEGGAGLGMSLVAIILAKHGASMNIDSTVGKGTTVSVSFPEFAGLPAENER
ncbi:MAG: HAMP domain-containing histidine kinase [Bacteroidales bacterium]|nr:HAMP domain-containing histidine kinase [Clostridium sp.]MCM1203597.1 HAMP domain-containing histidine kinase [Bacteroidales bacterium]